MRYSKQPTANKYVSKCMPIQYTLIHMKLQFLLHREHNDRFGDQSACDVLGRNQYLL